MPEEAEDLWTEAGTETVGELLFERGETLRKDLEAFNAVILQGEDQKRFRQAIDAVEKPWTKTVRTEYRKVCTDWGVQVVVAKVQKKVVELKAQLLEAVKGFLKEKVAVGDVPGNAAERRAGGKSVDAFSAAERGRPDAELSSLHSVGDLLGDAADGALQEFRAFQSLTLPEADRERVAAAFAALTGPWSRSQWVVHEATCSAWEVQRYTEKGKKRKAVADLQVELQARVWQYLEEVRTAPNLLMEHGPLTLREAALVARQPGPAVRRRARSKQAGVVPISVELKDALQLFESGASLTRQQKEPLLQLAGCKLRRRFGRSVVWLDSVPYLSLAVFCVLREVRMTMLQ